MPARAGALMLRREDDGQVVCERCVVADTLPRRLRGLLGHRRLPVGEGIVLRPGWSVHTAFMRFPIDVVFIDSDQVVLETVANLKPWRTAVHRGARDVVELAGGECARRGLKPGDRVTWAARPLRPESSEMDVVGMAIDAVHNGDRPAEPSSSKPPTRVLVGTRDDQFVRLTRFLLARNDFVVDSTKRLDGIVDLVERRHTDVVVLDASESLSEAARIVAAMDALHPHVRVLLVSDGGRPRPTTGLKIADKWEALETLPDEIRLSPAGSRTWS